MIMHGLQSTIWKLNHEGAYQGLHVEWMEGTLHSAWIHVERVLPGCMHGINGWCCIGGCMVLRLAGNYSRQGGCESLS